MVLPDPAPSRLPRMRPHQILLVVLGGLLSIGGAATVVAFSLLLSVLADVGRQVLPPQDRTVTAPDTLGGRPRLSGAEELITRAMRGQPDYGTYADLAAVYGSGQAEVMLHVVGGDFGHWGQGEVEYLFFDLRTAEIPVFDVTEVPAGPLGGVTACGTVRAGHDATIVCGWADRYSIGTLTWYGASLEEARAEFGTLRAEVEVES